MFVFLDPARLFREEYLACYKLIVHALEASSNHPHSVLLVNLPGSLILSKMTHALLQKNGISVIVRGNKREALGDLVTQPRRDNFWCEERGSYDFRVDTNQANSSLFKPGEFSTIPIIVTLAKMPELLLAMKAIGLTYPAYNPVINIDYGETYMNADMNSLKAWEHASISSDELLKKLSTWGKLLFECYAKLPPPPTLATNPPLTEDAKAWLFQLFISYVKKNPTNKVLLERWQNLRHPFFPVRETGSKIRRK
jgi:hypothetical protein